MAVTRAARFAAGPWLCGGWCGVRRRCWTAGAGLAHSAKRGFQGILDVVLILGYELDGTVQRDLPPAGAEAGVLTAGPQRLVEILEQGYALPAPNATPLQRMLGYQQALQQGDDGARFYSRSWQRDPLGVARALLAARDELLLAAPSEFSLAALAGCGGRLAELARIEELAAAHGVAPGLPDRLRRLIAELTESPIRPPVAELQLVEERRFWPALLQELQFVLEFRGTGIGSYAPPARRRSAKRALPDLARAQAAFDPPPAAPRRRRKPGAAAAAVDASGALGAGFVGAEGSAVLPPRADGSLALVRGDSMVEAADAAAALIGRWLGPRPAAGAAGAAGAGGAAGPSICVIAEEHGELLDAALLRAGIPPAGHERPSRGGDAGGLLPLLLQLLWDPVDPRTMQRYLLLTRHPLPGPLRNELLRDLDQMPGVWGPRWRAVIERYLETVDERRRAQVQRRLERWLPRPAHERCIPAADVAAHARAAAGWARRQAAAAVLQESAALADAVAAAVTAQPRERMSRPELERLLSEVEDATPRRRRGPAYRGGPRAASAPGTLLSPVDHVLWWHAAESTVGATPPAFFSTRERALLEGLGVRLQGPLLAVERKEQQWRRLAGLARKSLVLVYAASHGAQVDAPHPLWFILQQPFAGGAGAAAGAALTWPARAVDSLPGGRRPHPAAGPRLLRPRLPLLAPPFTPRWQLPELAGRALRLTESATSLTTLLGCPLRYVLEQHARLWPRRELGLFGGNRLLGIVAHDVLAAHLAAHPPSATEHTVETDLRERFADVFANVATLLRVPGMDRERAEVEAVTTRAAKGLRAMLRQGGCEVVAVERTYEVPPVAGARAGARAAAGAPAGAEAPAEAGAVDGEAVAGGAHPEEPALHGRVDLVIRRPAADGGGAGGGLAVIDLKWSGRRHYRNLLEQRRALQLAHYAIVTGKAEAQPEPPPTAYFVITTGELFTVHHGLLPGAIVVPGPTEEALWAELWPQAQAQRAGVGAGVVAVGVPEAHWRAGVPGAPLPAPCHFCDYGRFCGVAGAAVAPAPGRRGRASSPAPARAAS